MNKKLKLYIEGLDGMCKTSLLQSMRTSIWHSNNKVPYDFVHYKNILTGNKYDALDRGFFGTWTYLRLFENNNHQYYGLQQTYKQQLSYKEVIKLLNIAYNNQWMIIVLNVTEPCLKYLYDSKPNQKLPFDEWVKISFLLDELVNKLRNNHKQKFIYHKVKNPVKCRVSLDDLALKVFHHYNNREFFRKNVL